MARAHRAALVAMIVGLIAGCQRPTGPDDSNRRQPAQLPSTPATIEGKLAVLARCGLRLRKQFGVKDLVDSWDREALDKPGWDLALVSLGMEQEAPPWTPHCDNLWHFDSECIHGDGSYVAIARRIAGMTGGSLKLSNLKDHVDLAKKEAWLRFTCAGKPITIKPRVEDDWVDPNIFDRFCELLSEQAPSKMFIYYDLKGQDCIIGCLPRSQFAALQREVPGFRNLDGTGPTRVGSRPTPLPGG